MRIVAADEAEAGTQSEVETIRLTRAQLELLDRVSRAINPEMSPAFGRAYVVRLLLEQIEKAETGLTHASMEADGSRPATAAVRRRRFRKRR